jgi:hypothetical protein
MLKDLARRLRRGWDTLHDTRIDATTFLSVENDRDWNSDAAEAFRSKAGEVPQALGHAEARFWGTSYHLDRYAEELEAAQRDAGNAQAAIERAKRVQQRAADDWDRLARTAPESDAAGAARRDLTSANETIGLMGRSLQQAIQRAHDAASRCVAAIGETIQDPLRGLGPLYDPFSNQVAGRGPQMGDLDLARLANDVYDLGPSEVAGWRRLTPAELAASGFGPGELDDPRTGLRAAVYENNGRYVVAFAGTDPADLALGPDLDTNANQALGLPGAQYAQVRAIADKANRAFGNSLAFTGHSLGGGLAAYAALRTRRPAVTFNAAGLHDNTLRSTLPGDPEAARREATNGLVRGYHVRNEPVSFGQNGDGFDGDDDIPSAVGHQIELSMPDDPLTWGREIGGHGAGAVIESMERDQPWVR